MSSFTSFAAYVANETNYMIGWAQANQLGDCGREYYTQSRLQNAENTWSFTPTTDQLRFRY